MPARTVIVWPQGGGSVPPPSGNYVGTNLNALAYFSPQLPFLNIIKSGGSNGLCPQTSWATATSPGSTSSTHEEGYLQLDSNGYVTSLTASPTPSGGQVFTCVNVLLNYNIAAVPGVTYPYATAGTVYRLQATGNGVLQISGDASATLTITDGGTHSVTFTVATPSIGLVLSLTSIGVGTGAQLYPINISVVENALAASLDGGAIFHPRFLASLAGYKRFRFMDWLSTNNSLLGVQFTTALTSGATSATLTSNWVGRSGTYPMVIGNTNTVDVTQIAQATLTFGQTTCTFSPGLTQSVSASTSYGLVQMYASWANRPTLSSCFWTSSPNGGSTGKGAQGLGAPYEVCIALCNALSVDCWLTIPIWANTYSGQSGFWSSLAALVQTNLPVGQKCYIELSNEVWNGGFWQNRYSMNAGTLSFYPAQNVFYSGQEWYGTQVAQIADAFFSVYGATAFATQVIVSMGAQTAPGNGSSFLKVAMNTPNWTSAAYTHHIGAIHLTGYFGIGPSVADANAIVATPDPVSTYFGLAYSNTFNGTTYASIPAAGGLGDNLNSRITLLGQLAGQVWAPGGAQALPILGYEGGSAQDKTDNTGVFDLPASWISLIASAHRDTRFQYLYYDPTNQLSSKPGMMVSLKNIGFQSINQFNDCQPMGNFGEWGALESVQQTFSPTTSAPPKYQGIMKFIGRV